MYPVRKVTGNLQFKDNRAKTTLLNDNDLVTSANRLSIRLMERRHLR